MLRRVLAVTFSLAAAFVAACGHQVTPEPTNNNLAGHMVVKFRTAGPMDFTNFNYAIVLNTCGVNGEPYPNAYGTTFKAYSYAFLVGTTVNFGPSGVLPILLQYILTSGINNPLNPQIVPISSSTTILTLDDNGQNTEFTLDFTRDQLANPLGVSNECPFAPTPAPSAVASAAPTVWYVNLMTFQGNTAQDSLGQGGPFDNTYSLPVDITGPGPGQIQKAPDVQGAPSNQAAAIAGAEIDNFP
jgi:hypothetical protein